MTTADVVSEDGWEMQWRRVKRGFARLQKTCNDTEEYDDDLYHFFQDAWHLKEWLKADDQIPAAIRDGVEQHVSTRRAFRIVADVANRTKHVALKRPRAEDARISSRNVSVLAGRGDGECQVRCRVRPHAAAA